MGCDNEDCSKELAKMRLLADRCNIDIVKFRNKYEKYQDVWMIT